MAEGRLSKPICRFFASGYCRDGESCHFSHNMDHSEAQLCKYFMRGYCGYGSMCRFRHVIPNGSNNGNSSLEYVPEIPVRSGSSYEQVSPPGHPCTSSQPPPIRVVTSYSKPLKSTMTVLSKGGKPELSSWVNAPEFVPQNMKVTSNSNSQKAPSYVDVLCGGGAVEESSASREKSISSYADEFCPTYLMSEKCDNESCIYVHGLVCELCQLACLIPGNEEQQQQHIQECTKLIEAEMEHSFAVARSKDQVCGICMDIVMERSIPSQRRFGILPNCNHCFCLNCIRQWRQSKQFENKIIRSCPECRTQSNYVIPSRYWVDDKHKEEKDKLLSSYKDALSLKPCKYFKQGEGECPFGNKCFYLHALPDGTKKDVGPPRRTERYNADGELQLIVDNSLFDFIESRGQQWELLQESIFSRLLELGELGEQFLNDSASDTSDP